MSELAGARRQFGEGPLARVAAFVYTLLVVEALFLLTTSPGWAPALLLLERDASNLPLAAVFAVPLGPALSAALFALHHRSRDLADLHPARAFRRGYRLNYRGVLVLYLPWLGWLAVAAVTFANVDAAGVPGWWVALLLAVTVGATLWMANALVITSLFAFRARDVARLAAYFLARTPGATLGNTCLLVVAVGVVWVGSEAALGLLAVVFALFALLTCGPIITEVRRDFTA